MCYCLLAIGPMQVEADFEILFCKSGLDFMDGESWHCTCIKNFVTDLF